MLYYNVLLEGNVAARSESVAASRGGAPRLTHVRDQTLTPEFSVTGLHVDPGYAVIQVGGWGAHLSFRQTFISSFGSERYIMRQ